MVPWGLCGRCVEAKVAERSNCHRLRGRPGTSDQIKRLQRHNEKGKRQPGDVNVEIKVRNVQMVPTKQVKYLGVIWDCHGTFGNHVSTVARKAEQKMAKQARVMPNIKGPSSAKRRVLCGAVHSIVLYAAPIWNQAMNMKKYQTRLEMLQRGGLLRVASAYRTVSTEALHVITGSIPIDLLVWERKSIYENMGQGEDLKTIKSRVRQVTIEKWQQRWRDNTTVAQWTKRLIPNVQRWLQCKNRDINYFTTQILTGHGSFSEYTKRIGKRESDNCRYCDSVDTADNTLLRCRRWARQRIHMNTELGEELSLANSLEVSQEKWGHITEFVRNIMLKKEKDERAVYVKHNASTFIGANNELYELFKSNHFEAEITNVLKRDKIYWHFIPPRTPNFGGIWEARIKQVKVYFKKVVGDSILTMEMYTLLTQIEACLNSRPITPLSDDPTDLQALTPGHFLIGAPLNSVPEADLTSLPPGRLSR
ncbi:hypothetical protein ILUMI_03409 [Ignelater luminosus]|uniref:Reverse transcriptase n=1 Tax=Ignelater luminosus TaxID=2038154 RepID=A0A8K0DGC2_IGNLU|nr:hypothetical protein ILUMI_03409 [Ignelater luminosus]